MKHDWDSEGVNRKCLRCGLQQRRKQRVNRWGGTAMCSTMEWSRDGIEWVNVIGKCTARPPRQVKELDQ